MCILNTFPPSVDYIFYCLNGVLSWIGLKIVQLIMFFVLQIVQLFYFLLVTFFFAYSKAMRSKPYCPGFLKALSIYFYLPHSDPIHLELLLIYGMRQGSRYIPPLWISLWPNPLYWNIRLSSLHYCHICHQSGGGLCMDSLFISTG